MRRKRGAMLAVLGAAMTVALAGMVPSTSGAFFAKITDTTDTAATATTFKCADTFSAPANKSASNAYFEYALSDAAGTTSAVDSSSAANPGQYQGTHATDAGASPTACPNDSSKVGYSMTSNAGSQQWLTTTTAVGTSPSTFSLVVWFKTSTKAGRLIGLGANQYLMNGTYDRHIYFEPSGQLAFGTYNTTYQIVTTPSGTNYADGVWHQVVATFAPSGPTAGMFLYVDGALSASNATYTTAQSDTGWWRIGFDSLGAGWTGGTTTNGYFNGSMKFVAAYRNVLTAAEIRSEYTIGAPA